MALDAPPETTARKYRSKRQRPCDLCRTRKVQCKIPENQTRCELCKRLDRRCTFIIEPLRKECRLRHHGEGSTSRPSLNIPSVGGSREVPLPPVMLDLGNDEAEMDIDAGAFWTSPNPDHVSFNPEDASQMVEMGWASVDFSLTTPQQRSDLQQTGHNLTAPPNLAIPGPESPIRASVDGNSQLQLQGEEARGTYLSSNMHHPAQALSLDSRSRLSNTSPNALPAPMPADMEHLITFPGSDAFDGSPQSSGIGAGSVLGDGLDWPAEFSLDSKPGWSNQVIGLSSESDPFLLRHYLYNVHDTHPMFRLHFRKILDDKDMQTQIEEQSVPVGNVPLQFMMVNEEIWQDGLKSVERIVSGPHTEESDLKLLNEIVPNELGSRLLKL